jgi:hypothetical protein
VFVLRIADAEAALRLSISEVDYWCVRALERGLLKRR